jgi:hypothetical protein
MSLPLLPSFPDFESQPLPTDARKVSEVNFALKMFKKRVKCPMHCCASKLNTAIPKIELRVLQPLSVQPHTTEYLLQTSDLLSVREPAIRWVAQSRKVLRVPIVQMAIFAQARVSIAAILTRDTFFFFSRLSFSLFLSPGSGKRHPFAAARAMLGCAKRGREGATRVHAWRRGGTLRQSAAVERQA